MSYAPYPAYSPYAPSAQLATAQLAAAQTEDVSAEPLEEDTRSPGYTAAVWIFAILFIVVIVVVLVLLNLYKNSSSSYPLSAPRSIRSVQDGYIGLGQALIPDWAPCLRAGVEPTQASGSWELEVVQSLKPPEGEEGSFFARLVPLYGTAANRQVMQVSDSNLGNEWPPTEQNSPDGNVLALPNLGALITFASTLERNDSLQIWEFVSTGPVTELGAPYQIRLKDFPSYYLNTIPLNSAYGDRYPDYVPLYVTEGSPKTWFLV